MLELSNSAQPERNTVWKAGLQSRDACIRLLQQKQDHMRHNHHHEQQAGVELNLSGVALWRYASHRLR